MNKTPKYSIGNRVMCYPKDGAYGGWEFWGRIADHFPERKIYLVEDQDSDFFELEEDEIVLENEA